jgi:drug/metabolite transporter (DMT)-like permease
VFATASDAAKPVRIGLGLAIAGGLLLSFDLPFLRLANSDQWSLVAARGVFLFTAITLSWWAARRFTGRATPFIAGSAGAAVVVTTVLANISFIAAVKETTAANVVFITSLIPLITAVMSWLLLKERVHPLTWLATFLCFVGVAIIAGGSEETGQLTGDLFALISALAIASTFTIIRASGKNLATSMGLGGLAAAAIAAGMGARLSALSFDGWLYLGFAGLIVIPLAMAMISNAPRFLPAVDVSMAFLLETVLTPVWVWLIFGETASRNALMGGAIIVSTLVAHGIWRLFAHSGHHASASIVAGE